MGFICGVSLRCASLKLHIKIIKRKKKKEVFTLRICSDIKHRSILEYSMMSGLVEVWRAERKQ